MAQRGRYDMTPSTLLLLVADYWWAFLLILVAGLRVSRPDMLEDTWG